MDSHYHQVMGQREKITSTGKKFYFAYSSILDQEAFKVWAEEHSYQFFQLPKGEVAYLENTKLVFDFPSRWWGGLVASLGTEVGHRVYGIVFEVPEKEWPIVQHKEGFITNMCVETKVLAHTEKGIVEATAFVTNPSRSNTQGQISHRFIEALISGAMQSGLPGTYIQELRSKL